MTVLSVPSIEEVEEACSIGLGNPLHEFIEWHRPKNDQAKSADFDRSLAAALNFVVTNQS